MLSHKFETILGLVIVQNIIAENTCLKGAFAGLPKFVIFTLKRNIVEIKLACDGFKHCRIGSFLSVNIVVMLPSVERIGIRALPLIEYAVVKEWMFHTLLCNFE
jgi:hypothetical protein